MASTLMILNGHWSHSELFGFNLELFRTFRGPLFCKQITSRGSLEAGYSIVTLIRIWSLHDS